MQKKLIKVGEEYEVEIDGLWLPRAIKTSTGEVVKYPHGYTTRGVSSRYGTRARATVKALDQKRPTRSSSGYAAYTSFENDGVLVEFPDGFTVKEARKDVQVKTAVLSTKHIIRAWAEADSERVAIALARETTRKRLVSESEAFAPKLTATVAALRLAGFHVEQAEQMIRFWKNDIKGVCVINLKLEHTHSREDFVTGWSWQDARISRELLFDLIGGIE